VDQASVPPFMVLVGAFSNPSNVKALQAKIRELGIKVHTESFESPDGKRTRVRAGPFSSRAEAEKALTRMQRIGIIDGKIVTKQ
jgi:DedD protein